MKYTTEQVKRIKQALNETKDLLAKEMGYAEEYRNQVLIASYNAHTAKLTAMLKDVE